MYKILHFLNLFLREDKFQKFWVRLGEGNRITISVGRGGEEEPFISRHGGIYSRNCYFSQNILVWI